ncbi:hypothetical protein BUALT_BualtUnG0002300 [Buddleja alternifolia]|uniref:Uncharacterized protein n=1 Tax=Buddleja alternifolia TaxID=168488 RepID=A0AAV6W7Y5_9LAMI|nr:hypothetical protein BUALT_BualtUnG0002300 [Buddleja alternifolia]
MPIPGPNPFIRDYASDIMGNHIDSTIQDSERNTLMLRLWWTSSFLLSLARATVDAHCVIANHDHLKAQEYVDILGFLASTFLLGLSIRWKTDISFSISDDITSLTGPLLNGKNEKLSELGFKKPLDQDEIPAIDIKDSADYLSQAFDQCLEHMKERDRTQNPSIYKAIYIISRKKAAINALFAITSAATSYVGPYLINDFVSFLNEKKSRSLQSGYLLALGFLGAKLVETIAQRQWIFGPPARASVTGRLSFSYLQKGLNLVEPFAPEPYKWRDYHIMSVDVQRITDFIWYLNTYGCYQCKSH